MAVKWISSKFPGVRYYEHTDRKHGVRFDRYYAIRAQVGGKRREEGLGWASEGWSEQKAATVLAELKKAHITGEGAQSLAEKRAQAEAERKAVLEAEAQERRANITFGEVWAKYHPIAQHNKAPHTAYSEEALYRIWLSPVLAARPMKDIAPIHLERIKKNLAKEGRSAQTIRHALACVRQVFNFAKHNGFFTGDNPVTRVKKPAADARRVRFLTPDEATRLLEALIARSPATHDMALLALNAGLRAGEIFSLTWADLDFGNAVITLRDTKSGKTRQVPMTSTVQTMLETRKAQAADKALVFPSEKGGRMVQVSETFNRVVAALGFNEGVEDRRQKVVFHTLRHTCASWLVQNGVPLITVGRLLGHSTLAMTERYSHLAPDHFKQAVDTLEAVQTKKRGQVVVLNG